MFFTDDFPHGVLEADKVEEARLVTVQLNYLNVHSLAEVNDATPCVLTFKLNHGLGDAYSGYLFMRYLSQHMSGHDLSGYDDTSYGHAPNFDSDIQRNALVDFYRDASNFEKKYGLDFEDASNANFVAPNLAISRYALCISGFAYKFN